MSKTAGQLVYEAKVRADQEKSKFVADPQWLIWISDAWLALYDLLVSSFEDYYLIDLPFTVDASSIFTLPPNFYKLRGVDRNSNDKPIPVRPYLFEERHLLRDAAYWSGYYPGVEYNIRGQDKLYMRPRTAAVGGDYTLWYIPIGVAITDINTVVNGINGWENYISIDAAIKARDKEETETRVLENEKMEIINRIKIMSKRRDASGQRRTVDVRGRDMYRGGSYAGGFEGEGF